ncbi:amidase [Variovorax sp. RCC_210]|uniref:amidase n=1 Tax=Variovorax sp. RCC_210 TaxID=3239217 RepID=UPI003524EC24
MNSLDCDALSTAYRKGELSPVAVVRAALDRAEAIQGALNPFTFLDVEGAIESARQSEARWLAGCPSSAIDGVPTTLKDIFHVMGWPVRYGSLTASAVPVQQDAPAVQRLREAGAVFIGQTTSPEYAWKTVTDSRAFGTTRNPWNRDLTPGGSSGGAAVAAACGAGVLHLGTDGGGSIRIPAAFTGTVGMKPTFGRVANFPPSSFGTVAHVGPMTRRVKDAAHMLRIMSGRDLRDWTQPPMAFSPLEDAAMQWRGKRVGYWKTPCVGAVDVEVAAAVETVLVGLATAGASIVEIQLPFQDELLEIFNRHWCVGAALRLSSIEQRRHAELDSGFVEAARRGAGYSSTDRLGAEVRRSHFGAAMDQLLARFDLVLSPTVPVLPFEVNRDVPPRSDAHSWAEWSSFSFPINLSQQPACSVPCGFSEDGLPIGLQIVGGRGEDASVIAAAAAIEGMFPDLGFFRGAGPWSTWCS